MVKSKRDNYDKYLRATSQEILHKFLSDIHGQKQSCESTPLSHFRKLRHHGKPDAVDPGLVGAEVPRWSRRIWS